jgi:hypothetical protein
VGVKTLVTIGRLEDKYPNNEKTKPIAKQAVFNAEAASRDYYVARVRASY